MIDHSIEQVDTILYDSMENEKENDKGREEGEKGRAEDEGNRMRAKEAKGLIYGRWHCRGVFAA